MIVHITVSRNLTLEFGGQTTRADFLQQSSRAEQRVFRFRCVSIASFVRKVLIASTRALLIIVELFEGINLFECRELDPL